MLILILGVAAAAVLFYLYIVKPMNYWKDRGVDQGNPKWIFGHFWDASLGKELGVEAIQKVYKQSPNARYTGMYRFSNPTLVVTDPDLIKQITVKDFEYFTDHPELIPPEADPMWTKSLLNLTGSKWRDMRAHLSPSFTSSKMKVLFVLMTECSQNLVQYILAKKQEVVTVEIKDIISRYTNDVIATTAFGVKVDSLAQPDNEFYEMGKKVADFSSVWKSVKFFLYWLVPAVKNILKIQFVTDDCRTYFQNIIEETIKTREEKGIVRADMLHLLTQARKEARQKLEKAKMEAAENTNDSAKENVPNVALDLTNEDITAQAIIFFIAGFESVSSFITFSTYELAINPDIQERLWEEIRDTLEDCEGKVTYEAIMKMKYMDMVVSETMRKWPHFILIDRLCTKPYTIQPTLPGEKPLHLDKGTELYMLSYSMQRDPKYFPDPDRFDPERFSDENKSNINPYTYFPFGVGPRVCIGFRFAFLEGKILLFNLLSRFEIVPVEKTMIPMKLSKAGIFNLKPEGGLWLGLKKRKE